MADFKTAIGALETGNIKFESLSKQIDILLSKTPHFANKMLVQLDESYENKDVNYKQYSQLKTQIYKFGPTETSETASDSAANNGSISELLILIAVGCKFSDFLPSTILPENLEPGK